ncbi:sulfatase-like hydrolase/transferase, partial [bacterium]|nr:sulfatase-like hydrolase/transferase [bacterium]
MFNRGSSTRMKYLYSIVCGLLLFVYVGVLTTVDAADGKRPTIVFILADDLGAKDLSNEGSTFYESPHIDSIAASGVKFTHGYATCQVCSPSRASILTGKYPVNNGITTWIGDRAGEDWRKANRHDSHMPAEYDHNL